MNKRVLFLSPNIGYKGGGAERQIVNVACLLKNYGHKVEFLCYCEGSFYEDDLKKHNITVHWKILPNYIKRMFSIRKFIREQKYDVVISFQETPNFLNCFAAIGGKKWKVITGERSAKEEFFKTKKGKIFAWFRKFSDKIVCNSENAKRMWIKHYPRYKDKITVIYNSVNIKQGISNKYVPKKNGKVNIVVLASYQYLKNPIGLIKALISMNQTERNLFIINWYGRSEVISNDTECYQEAISLIEKYQLGDVIHLNEVTDKPYEIIKKSDFVALFSRIEGLPNAICEGMYLGKPIIMTKVSDYNILVDDTNGYLCDWNDIVSIKNAILDACNLKTTEIIEKGNNSQKKANTLFANTNIMKKWNDII